MKKEIRHILATKGNPKERRTFQEEAIRAYHQLDLPVDERVQLLTQENSRLNRIIAQNEAYIDELIEQHRVEKGKYKENSRLQEARAHKLTKELTLLDQQYTRLQEEKTVIIYKPESMGKMTPEERLAFRLNSELQSLRTAAEHNQAKQKQLEKQVNQLKADKESLFSQLVKHQSKES